MLEFIDVNKIYPHPDNPRKDVGDVSELAESIKVSGILQNLTLVPKDKEKGTYTVIIGHRRLAASKLAGLEKVPCVIADMSEKEQVATMLLENMQRNDLTVYEQAQGFQMMLDFGETVESIAEQTGFSQSTVRRRVKLLDLDKDKFQASVNRGATIMDFIKLEQIKDVDLKNEVLQTIGTPNFEWNLKNAIQKEKESEKHARNLEIVKTFATQINENDCHNLKWVSSCWTYGSSDIEVPEDANACPYFYSVGSGGNIHLYREYTNAEIKQKKDDCLAEQKEAEKKKELSNVADRAFELRKEFIFGFSANAAKKNAEIIMQFAAETILFTASDWMPVNTMNFSKEIAINEQTEKALLLAAYYRLNDNNLNYADYARGYKGNARLDLLYGVLQKLGYQMSDEERAWADGSHELYVKGDEEQKNAS